jgi:hypothetical protein
MLAGLLHRLPPPWRPAASFLWAVVTRFWFCWVIVYASYRLKENYPFSNNPMYTRWDDETYVLHATDEKDQILFFDQQFGQTAIRLKKMVKARVSRLKKDSATKALGEAAHYQISGAEALKHFHEKRWAKVSPAAVYTTLKLWRTELALEGGKVVNHDARVVAQYTPPSPAVKEGAQP